MIKEHFHWRKNAWKSFILGKGITNSQFFWQERVGLTNIGEDALTSLQDGMF